MREAFRKTGQWRSESTPTWRAEPNYWTMPKGWAEPKVWIEPDAGDGSVWAKFKGVIAKAA